MFGKKNKLAMQSKSSALLVPDQGRQKLYNRTGGITGDYVYKPVEVQEAKVYGDLGPVISYEKNEYLTIHEELPCENFYLPDLFDDTKDKVYICKLYGVPAAASILKEAICMLYNCGYWGSGAQFQNTKIVIAVMFSDVGGCGTVNGDTIWVSPEGGLANVLNTTAHECFHNAGWTGDDEDHAWIYANTPPVVADCFQRSRG